MRVLIACEESQRITEQFLQLGIECYSCDIKPTSGNYPQNHIQGCALEVAYGGEWSLMIAHPPCTFLSKAGAHLMYPKGKLNMDRYNQALTAKKFFLALLDAPIKHIAIENPTPLKVMNLPTHNQVIEPFMFGEPYTKRTLLWLKNLPPLIPTNIVEPVDSWTRIKGSKTQRSKTFKGIAKAIAEQWKEPTNYQMDIEWIR